MVNLWEDYWRCSNYYESTIYGSESALEEAIEHDLAAHHSSPKVEPKIPNEIDESLRKSKVEAFKAAVLERIEQFKKIKSQGPELDQSNGVAASKSSDLEKEALEEKKMKADDQSDRVAASKSSDLEKEAPEEEKMKTDVLEEKTALESEIAELRKRKEEVENQIRVMNERLEERLKEVARKEEEVDRQAKKWAQNSLKASSEERALREKSALQEAKSVELSLREDAILHREEYVHEREEEIVRIEEKNIEREDNVDRREDKLDEREQMIMQAEEMMVRTHRDLNTRATHLAAREQEINRFWEEKTRGNTTNRNKIGEDGRD
ncbi:hypothetical protein EAE96_007517 [Botrytis aclada]|nr:hypothetical protein EAE96_007517 [Botrytis aclada]